MTLVNSVKLTENALKLSFFILVAILFVNACTPPQDPFVGINGNTMGTTYSVKFVRTTDEQKALTQVGVQEEIDNLLININKLMSTYIPDSELSLLNKTAKDTRFAISPQSEYVIKEAIRLHELSGGMLDITVGPLVNLWGFGPQAKPEKLPSEQQLNDIREYVGIDKFTLLDGHIIKSHDNVYIDLSTIAKGYAVDAIAQLLLNKGIDNFLVEIGGEMRVSGSKPHEQNWLVAIEKPVSNERAVQSIIYVGNNAVATSGDYRIYFESEGKRYSHLIDPTTGYPIQHNLVAVSVVAEKSITADGLATALIVMGKDAGFAMAEKNNIAAMFITKEQDSFVEYTTSAFKAKVQVVKPGQLKQP